MFIVCLFLIIITTEELMTHWQTSPPCVYRISLKHITTKLNTASVNQSKHNSTRDNGREGKGMDGVGVVLRPSHRGNG